jgi:putative SOS response-associated peptidase YedK
MCGRYAASKDPDALVEEFEVEETFVDQPLGPDYNVAPTKRVYVVMERRHKAHDAAADEDAEGAPPSDATRQLRVAKWGLVPSWAKDPAIGARMINARMETVAEKPAFRRAFAARRCLLPADGFFEWYTPTEPVTGEPPTKSGKPRKQPFFIHPKDGSTLVMAGLYEWWHDPSTERDDPEGWLLSTVVITTDASDAVGRIHDRMPLVVARQDWEQWLDPDVTDRETVHRLLTPATSQRLAAYPVTTRVNDVRHNGPELLDPLPLDDSGAGLPAQPTLL